MRIYTVHNTYVTVTAIRCLVQREEFQNTPSNNSVVTAGCRYNYLEVSTNKHHRLAKAVVLCIQALVRERLKDWGSGLCKRLNKKMVELTGDYTPDLRALLAADIIICTPEKWDGISRNWQNRSYVQKVCLLVIDEIHLLGADR